MKRKAMRKTEKLNPAAKTCTVSEKKAIAANLSKLGRLVKNLTREEKEQVVIDLGNLVNEPEAHVYGKKYVGPPEALVKLINEIEEAREGDDTKKIDLDKPEDLSDIMRKSLKLSHEVLEKGFPTLASQYLEVYRLGLRIMKEAMD